MKKKTTQLIVVLILLAGAIGAYFLLMNGGDQIEEAEPVDDSVYILGGFPQPHVQQVEITNGQDTFVIENLTEPVDLDNLNGDTGEESLYTIQGLSSGDLTQSRLRAVMNTAGNLAAKKVIAESGGDKSAYGLDAPAATLTVTYGDGQVTMDVGNEAPGDEGIYVSVGDAVYLVATSKLTGVTESRYYFVEKTVTPGNNATTIIDTITLSGGFSEDPYTIEKLDGGEDGWHWPSSYRMTAPEELGVDDGAVEILQNIYGITALEVVDAAAFQDDTSAAYGLAEPYLLAEVKTVFPGGNEADRIDPFTLAVSSPDSDCLAYAQTSVSSFIYRIDLSSLPFLEFSRFDYMEKVVFAPGLDLLSAVEVSTGGRTVLFNLGRDTDGEENETLTVTADGDTIDTDDFRSFYALLTAARYDAAIEEADRDADENSEADPEGQDSEGGLLLQFRYVFRDGGDSVVSFRSGPARRAVAALNGENAHYAQTLYVDQVLGELQALTGDRSIGNADGPTTVFKDGDVAGSTNEAQNYNP